MHIFLWGLCERHCWNLRTLASSIYFGTTSKNSTTLVRGDLPVTTACTPSLMNPCFSKSSLIQDMGTLFNNFITTNLFICSDFFLFCFTKWTKQELGGNPIYCFHTCPFNLLRKAGWFYIILMTLWWNQVEETMAGGTFPTTYPHTELFYPHFVLCQAPFLDFALTACASNLFNMSTIFNLLYTSNIHLAIGKSLPYVANLIHLLILINQFLLKVTFPKSKITALSPKWL